METAHRSRLWPLGVLAVLLVAGIWWAAGDPFQPRETAAWKTIEHEGVRVDIPGDWEGADVSDCEFRFVRWTPPDADPCGNGGGVAFYVSATFDPLHRPGIWREPARDGSRWGGYVYAGDYAVYASEERRAVVAKILGSAQHD
ncbi:MAG: hypothetical protein ABWY19_12000 [Marmoricola sp.]